MMQQLYIVGAGGFGREVLGWAKQHPDYLKHWTIAGFLDDRSDALSRYCLPEVIIGSIHDFVPQPGDRLVCALGKPAVKQKCVEVLQSRGGQFLTLVHPSVILGERVELGEGVVIGPGCILTCDIVLQPFVTLNLNCCVGHDVQIGRYTQINSFGDVTGGVRIGDRVLIGSHATILPGQLVENNAVVGAGSVVAGTVKAGSTVFGVPAKPLHL